MDAARANAGRDDDEQQENGEGEADPGARMNVERLARFADRELLALGVGQQRAE